MRVLILLTIVALWAPVVLTQNRNAGPAAGTGTPQGNAEEGKKTYVDLGCFQCHGFVAQGGVGPRLAPRPMAFAAFSKYVRQPSGEMPPYTVKVLSDRQMEDVYSFLRSVPEPPAVETIPLLK